MAEETVKPIRLLNFVSEEQVLSFLPLYRSLSFADIRSWAIEFGVRQLEESKKERGERVEDGTFQRDRALYEVNLLPQSFDQIAAAEWLLSFPWVVITVNPKLHGRLRTMFFPFNFQILKENKDKKDAEFNERFKHS